MLLHGSYKWLYPWKRSGLVLCPAVQVCGQLGTRLGVIYETSLGLGLVTSRFVHSAGVGIVWLASLIPSPQSMSYSVVPRPEKQSGNEFMYLSIGIPL